MGYMLLGRKSIFAVSFITFFLCFGISIVYFILFGKLCERIMDNILGYTGFWTSKMLFKVLLGVSLLPLVLKKELKEMKGASIILFSGIVIFMGVLFNDLFFLEWTKSQDGTPAHLSDKNYWTPSGKTGIVEAIANLLIAFMY